MCARHPCAKTKHNNYRANAEMAYESDIKRGIHCDMYTAVKKRAYIYFSSRY